MKRFVVGVDVGGTFTDLLLVDTAAHTFAVAKVPTTPADQSAGFMDGLAALDMPLEAIDTIVHGTTIGTNAILERKGVRCGLITTRGFRDALELGRRTRPYAYGLGGSFEALIPREDRCEVTERIDAGGDVLTALDESEVRAVTRDLAARGAEALVIHFLHSYANPAHEERCYEIAREIWPNAYITVGSRILPEFREFERVTTATLNAYVQPIMARYIGRLSQALRAQGFGTDLLVMQGNGGMMAGAVAGEHSVHTVLSGPAAGVIAAAQTGQQAGFRNVISCDMGGTSFDVAVIRDGTPAVSSEKDIDYAVPVRVPMIDIHTIGAGGGSIARVSGAGLLLVGPQSAGSRPGPICYGRGGTLPTVTDANLLLGRLSTRSITSIEAHVDLDVVRDAMVEQIGSKLGLDAEQTAAAILAVTNNQMAGAIRLVSIEKGYDPRDFVLFAFGGAGPLHATALARELGIPKVLVPRFPGITSALGCVLADVRHDFVRTLNRPLQSLTAADVDPILQDHAEQGHSLIAREGVSVTGVEVVHEADLLYLGQTHVLRIPVEGTGFDAARVLERFAVRYRERFEVELPEMRAMLVNLRTTVIGRRPAFDLRLLAEAQTTTLMDALVGVRRAHFNGEWWDTLVYRRESIPVGARLTGPAIVEQLDTTTVIDPESSAQVDHLGNLIINVHEGADGHH